MKGREFYDQAIEKAVRWNHGRLPDARIQLTFICNELKGKVVLDEAELRQVIQEFPWKGIPARGVPIEEIQEQFEKIGDWFKKIREILGEEGSGGSVTVVSHKAEAHRGGGEPSPDAEQWWAVLDGREPGQNQTKEDSEDESLP